MEIIDLKFVFATICRCNKEGLNIYDPDIDHMATRIGIVGDEQLGNCPNMSTNVE